MNPDNVYIDFNAIAKELMEKAAIEALALLAPDEKSRTLIIGMLNIHRKYGIDLKTSMSIIKDLGELFDATEGE